MLKLENVSYSYQKDGSDALKNLNMDFNKGSCIGLLGENGAGKSTIFLNMLGIYKPTKGKVYYKGKPLSYKKKDLNDFRSKVSMVFQDPDQQIFYSNVQEDIAFALKNLRLPENVIEEKVQKAMKDVGISHLADRPVHYLSYGQKKRVAIAGIIAMDCETILFDEPTAGLDPSMTEAIKDLLAQLIAQGKNLIISSHDMDFIYDVCDYVYVISHGELVTEGQVDQVFLEEKAIQDAGLIPPSLVRVHLHGGIPLFRKEEELYAYLRKQNKKKEMPD